MAAGDVIARMTTLHAKRGAVFDGVNDEIAIPHAKINYTSGFSIGWWQRPILVNGVRWVWGFEEANIIQCSFNHQGGAGQLDVAVHNGAAWKLVTDAAPSTTAWTHYLFTYDGTNMILYKNGVSEDTNTESNIDASLGGNRLSLTTNSFSGLISDVQLFKKCLSADEALKTYGGERITGLVSHWELSKDYSDSVGSLDGTNNGTYLATVDDTLPPLLSGDRTTANDVYLISQASNGQVISVVVEEAP